MPSRLERSSAKTATERGTEYRLSCSYQYTVEMAASARNPARLRATQRVERAFDRAMPRHDEIDLAED